MNIKPSLFLTLLSVFSLNSCLKDDDQLPLTLCPDDFTYGLSITLIDADTSQTINEEASIVIFEEEYSELLRFSEVTNSFLGAFDRVGIYQISVASNRYQSQLIANIEVTRDDCNVVTKQITITLEPN